MKIALAFLALSSVACTTSAKCVPYPPLLATVEVHFCQAFSVESSSSPWSLDGAISPVHEPGQRHRATLLTGEVQDVAFVSEAPGESLRVDVKPFISAGSVHLELPGDPAEVCPDSLPAEVTVVSDLRCCDVVPSSGGCISPFVRVVVEPHAERWHRLGPYVQRPPPRRSWWSKWWN